MPRWFDSPREDQPGSRWPGFNRRACSSVQRVRLYGQCPRQPFRDVHSGQKLTFATGPQTRRLSHFSSRIRIAFRQSLGTSRHFCRCLPGKQPRRRSGVMRCDGAQCHGGGFFQIGISTDLIRGRRSPRTGFKRLSSLSSTRRGVIPDMRVSEYRPLRASIHELTSAHRRFAQTSYAWLPDPDAVVDLNYPFPRCDLLQ
jgi:hypothetical protein